MEKQVLNYRIIIEPDKQTGTGKPGFTAYCPTLGVADDGDTIEEALQNRIPVLLYGGQGRYQHVPAEEINVQLEQQDFSIKPIYHASNIEALKYGLQHILTYPLSKYSRTFDEFIYSESQRESLGKLIG